jgi:hypothetical protein
MMNGVIIKPKIPIKKDEDVERKHGKIGEWVTKNRDTILIGIATAGLLMQTVRIFKK